MEKTRIDYKETYKEEPENFNDKVVKLQEIFKSVKDQYNLKNFTFILNRRMKRTLGQCVFNGILGEVQVSEFYVKNGDWLGVIDTLLHECAHAVDFNHRGTSAHDAVWKYFARMLGANPKRVATTQKVGQDYVEALKATAKYTLECPECGVRLAQHRKTKNTYGCGTCNTDKKKKERGHFLSFKVIQNY